MLTTAGVVCFSLGASEETPLACAMTGSGTLAIAFALAPAIARLSSVAAKNCVLMGQSHFLGRKSALRGRPTGPASMTWRISWRAPGPRRGSVRNNALIGIRADVG